MKTVLLPIGASTKRVAIDCFGKLKLKYFEFAKNVPVRSILSIWLFWIVFVHFLPSILGGLFDTLPHEKKHLWPYYMEIIETPLTRWDSRWFHEVVERGYYYYGPTRQSSIRFYPLYPLLIRAVKSISPFNTFQAGTLVSSVATLGTLFLLADISRKNAQPNAVFSTINTLLFFPSAFVLATVYSESTTIFCFVLTVYLAKADAYALAGIAAFAAGISRINGFLVLLPLFVIATTKYRTSKSIKPFGALAIGVLGAIAFPCFLWLKFDDALLYFHIHDDAWIQAPRPFYTFLKDVFLGAISAIVDRKVPHSVDSTGMNLFAINLSSFLLLFWALRASIQKKRWDDAALMAGACLVASSAGNLLSLVRIVIIYYPITLRLGEAVSEKPALRFAVFFSFVAIQALLLTLFVRWTFVF